MSLPNFIFSLLIEAIFPSNIFLVTYIFQKYKNSINNNISILNIIFWTSIYQNLKILYLRFNNIISQATYPPLKHIPSCFNKAHSAFESITANVASGESSRVKNRWKYQAQTGVHVAWTVLAFHRRTWCNQCRVGGGFLGRFSRSIVGNVTSLSCERSQILPGSLQLYLHDQKTVECKIVLLSGDYTDSVLKKHEK